MIILTIRTDRPEAELGLYDKTRRLSYHKWPAHRQLAETIHLQIKQLLGSSGLVLKDLEGIVVYRGPGSFTGLRIGLSVGNALAESLDIPITSGAGGQWLRQGVRNLAEGRNEKIVIPDYGSEPHTTTPQK